MKKLCMFFALTLISSYQLSGVLRVKSKVQQALPYAPACAALAFIGSTHLGMKQRVSVEAQQNVLWGCFGVGVVVIAWYLYKIHTSVKKTTNWITREGDWALEAAAENTINLNAQRNGFGIEVTIMRQELEKLRERLNMLETATQLPAPIHLKQGPDSVFQEIRKEAGQAYKVDPKEFVAESISAREDLKNNCKNNDERQRHASTFSDQVAACIEQKDHDKENKKS